MDGISVIICCFNSELRIRKTLEHLIRQEISGNLNWEIIIVDNNCSDQTADVARKFLYAEGKQISWKIVQELKSGLSFARETGISESRYELILFCDDDNHLSKDYLQRVFDHFNSKPTLGVLGGFASPVYDSVPPQWWHQFESWYATGPQASGSGWLTKTRACVYGAGSCYRKKGFLKLREAGFKSRLSDRKKNLLSSGGDIELGNAFVLMGFDIYYDEQLKLNHYIPVERMNLSYIGRLSKQGSPMHPVLYAYLLHLKNIRRNKWQLKSWYVASVFAHQSMIPVLKLIFCKSDLIYKWVMIKNYLWIFSAYLFSGNAISESYESIKKLRNAE